MMGVVAFAGVTQAQPYALEHTGCDPATVPDKTSITTLRCGRLLQQTKDYQLEIPFVIMPAKASSRSRDLLVVIPGGPGVGAQTQAENLEYWYQLFANTRREFDLLFYSPRGTPGAQPYWHCETLHATEKKILSENLSSKSEARQRYLALENCLKTFAVNSLSRVLSAQAQVVDLQALIELLPYEQVHLFGDSWGTRIALLATSEKISTRILDSVYPPGKGELEDWLSLLDYRFDIYRHNFENFDALWSKAISKLQANPVRVHVDTEFVINPQRLAHLAFYSLYRENLRKPFVSALGWLVEGKQGEQDLELVLSSYLRSQFDVDFSPLAWYATECSERSILDEASFPRFSQTHASYDYFLEGMKEYDPCQLPALKAVEAKNTQIKVEVKTLILSGEFDPVTPNTWAHQLHAQLGRSSTLYTAAGAGHGIIAGDYCSAELIVEFIRKKKVNPHTYCH